MATMGLDDVKQMIHCDITVPQVGADKASSKSPGPFARLDIMDDLTADEIDLAILDLYEYGDDNGVSPVQMMRKLQEAIRVAYLIASEIEDNQSIDPMPSLSIH